MNDETLDLLLREWGALSKYEQERGEASNDFHVLERARAFAPGTRERAARQLVGRDGGERRTLMARELRACGVRRVPMDYVDPVPCGSRSGGGGAGLPSRDDTPKHLRPVIAAAAELYRMDMRRGLVLRQEYCGYGPQAMKAERVSLAMEDKRSMGLRKYREALAHARGWMAARLGA